MQRGEGITILCQIRQVQMRQYLKMQLLYILTLVSRRFPVLGEVSFCVRTLPICAKGAQCHLITHLII